MTTPQTPTRLMIAAAASSFWFLQLSFVLAAAPATDEALVAHWTFDELSPDGTSAPDASGGKHHGRLTGPSVLVGGKHGKALKLAGPPEQVNVGDLGVRAPATVAFWFNTRELFGGRMILSQLTGPEDAAGALRFDGGQLEVCDGRAWHLLVKWGLRFDAWQHVAVVFEPDGKAAGYLNGQPKESAKAGFQLAGVEAAIAAKHHAKTGNPFIGRLDDFRIYNRALSPDQIRNLCSGSK